MDNVLPNHKRFSWLTGATALAQSPLYPQYERKNAWIRQLDFALR